MLNNNSFSICSHTNSLSFKLEKEEDEFNINDDKNPNMSMFMGSSYINSEIQEIHDGSNIKENEINDQFNTSNKKELALDKSMNFQNMSVEDEFINKDDVTGLGKDTGIEPIDEREEDDDVNESFYHGDVNFIDEFEKKEKFDKINININNNIVNNSVIYEGSGNNLVFLDDIDRLKIKNNLICLKKTKNNSCFNLTNSIVKDTSNSNSNKSVLNENKRFLFNVTKQSDDFITSNIKLNMSSCQLSFKSKKNKRGRKQILLSGIKTEIMDKTFLREFKNYLKLKKKEFQNIFDKDYVFWNEFLENKNPPFYFTQGGKRVNFGGYNKKFMKFIFSKNGVNILYSKFISESKYVKFDKIFAKKKSKKRPDYYTIAFYKFYRENLNKLYSKDFSDSEINVDDFDINNISMDLVSNSFQ